MDSFALNDLVLNVCVENRIGLMRHTLDIASILIWQSNFYEELTYRAFPEQIHDVVNNPGPFGEINKVCQLF